MTVRQARPRSGLRRNALHLALSLAALLPAFLTAQGQTFRFFSIPSEPSGYGISPIGTLAQDAQGNLYGTTSGAGFWTSTVFEVTTSGKLKLLDTFDWTDGYGPMAGLISDGSGNFYGTTSVGGTADSGTVFEMDAAGNETVLYSFQNVPDGAVPEAPLVMDDEGNLYGTTVGGGNGECGSIDPCGIVFEVGPAGNEMVLYRFTGGTDGNYPQSGLVRDSSGNLYGTASRGGEFGGFGGGTVFKIDPDGNETTLHTFQGNPDGAAPTAGLIQDKAGNFYGTTAGGGSSNCGTIFKLDTSDVETVLYSFTCGSDGATPSGPLVADAAGNLYGITGYGGQIPCTSYFARGCGTVYRLGSDGQLTVLHTFTFVDGAGADNGLLRDKNGYLYGETSGGGSGNCGFEGNQYGCGVIFQLKP